MLKWSVLAALLAAPAGAASLDAVNAARAEAGLEPVTENAALVSAAQAQAAHMAAAGTLTHEGPEGASILERVTGTGYRSCFAAENVAMGQMGEDSVIGAWMNSKGHRRNILADRATDAGLAKATDAAGRPYWALVLATGC